MGLIMDFIVYKGKEMEMKKKAISILLVIAISAASAIISHIWTMENICIETDGNGDSAIVKIADRYWFYGINGHEPHGGEFMKGYNGNENERCNICR